MTNEHLTWIQNYLKEIYKTPILENFMGLQIAEVKDGEVSYSMKIIDKHSNFYGYIHGGIFASIADVVMGVSCITLGKRVVTIDMSLSYIKNAPIGSTITAIGKVISNGRTIMRAVGEIYNNEQQLLVMSQASYFVTGRFSEDEFPQKA